MKNLFFILFFTAFVFCNGCITNKRYNATLKQLDSLSSEIDKLTIENDDLRNGESRLSDLIDYSVRNNNFLNAKRYIDLMREKYPFSQKLIAIEDQIQSIDEKARQEQIIIDKARSDSIRLANINDLGIWQIGSYKDEFDRDTGSKYIYCIVYGVFSNTATTNSPLRIQFFTGQKGYLHMSLFEYNGSNPIKGSRYKFSIKVMSMDNNTYRYIGQMNSNGFMSIYHSYETDSKVDIYDLFKISKPYHFEIRDKDSPTSVYSFKVNPSFFENALLKAGIELFSDSGNTEY